ncbi:hypothetical protein T484DRAFT_2025318, partial [Baffinella frigidus]
MSGEDVTGLALKAFSFTKNLYKQGKNAVLNVGDIEAKVKEATNSEAWGPSGTLQYEITQATTDPEAKQIVLMVLFMRLKEPPTNWRKVYKALTLLDYLAKNATRRVLEDITERVDRIEACKHFYYIEPDTGKDQGVNVKEKAAKLGTLLRDPERLQEERAQAKLTRDKFHSGRGGAMGSGMGSEDMGHEGHRRARRDFDEDWDEDYKREKDSRKQ